LESSAALKRLLESGLVSSGRSARSQPPVLVGSWRVGADAREVDSEEEMALFRREIDAALGSLAQGCALGQLNLFLRSRLANHLQETCRVLRVPDQRDVPPPDIAALLQHLSRVTKQRSWGDFMSAIKLFALAAKRYAEADASTAAARSKWATEAIRLANKALDETARGLQEQPRIDDADLQNIIATAGGNTVRSLFAWNIRVFSPSVAVRLLDGVSLFCRDFFVGIFL
jgi:hypothetical protein